MTVTGMARDSVVEDLGHAQLLAEDRSHVLISTSTPAGRSRRISESTVFGVGSRMSSSACGSASRSARASPCGRAGHGSRSTGGSRWASGTGPGSSPGYGSRSRRSCAPTRRPPRGRTPSGDPIRCSLISHCLFSLRSLIGLRYSLRPQSLLEDLGDAAGAHGAATLTNREPQTLIHRDRVINSTVISVLSPGITISVPSGNVTAPVTSVVRK
jgi:hypothetical protein